MKGIVLILILIITAIALAIVLGVAGIFLTELAASQNIHFSTVAYYIADSAIEAELYRDRNGVGGIPVVINSIDFTCNNSSRDADTCLAALDNGGTYIYTVDGESNPPSFRTVVSNGTYQGIKRSIEVNY